MTINPADAFFLHKIYCIPFDPITMAYSEDPAFNESSHRTAIGVVVVFLILLCLIILPVFDYSETPATPRTTTGDVAIEAKTADQPAADKHE